MQSKPKYRFEFKIKKESYKIGSKVRFAKVKALIVLSTKI
jgi:hypothetical protein